MRSWINVDELLPQDDKLKVVRYCYKNTGQHLGIALSHYCKSQTSGKFDFDLNRGTQPIKVTHWIDIPEAPESNHH